MGIYFTIGGAGALLILTSVLYDLFWHKGAHRAPPPPADLLECNRDVRRLLEGLGDTSAQLQRDAVEGDAHDLGGRWEEFAKEWQQSWDLVNERCRFDELSGTRQPLAYERMAEVHRKLVTMKLSYREMMAHFDESLARELAHAREALDKSRADLEKRTLAP
jgi:hypothetical protein